MAFQYCKIIEHYLLLNIYVYIYTTFLEKVKSYSLPKLSE